jgi:hypothetical protein
LKTGVSDLLQPGKTGLAVPAAHLPFGGVVAHPVDDSEENEIPCRDPLDFPGGNPIDEISEPDALGHLKKGHWQPELPVMDRDRRRAFAGGLRELADELLGGTQVELFGNHPVLPIHICLRLFEIGPRLGLRSKRKKLGYFEKWLRVTGLIYL